MKNSAGQLPRVLVVSPRLDIGGTEMHLARILPELRRRGLDISIFVLDRGGELEAQLVFKGVPIAGPLARSVGFFRKLRAVISLRCEIQRRRPDILHCFLPGPYLVGSVASAGIRDLNKIMSRRSLAVYQKNHFILAQVEKWLHRFTKVLLGNSTAVVEELVVECGNKSKVGLIYNGIHMFPEVSPDRRNTLRQEFGIPLDAFVLVVGANFIEYKGHIDLLEAIGGMKAVLDGPWRLMLIGHDLGMGAKLRCRAANLGITDNIIWIEDRADAQVLLAAADIAVVPSHQEGFSNSLIEAMAAGLPVIATRVGGNIDAIVDFESGLLVPVGERAALEAAISRLYRDRVLRDRLGAAARARVNANFSLDRCVQSHFDLYKHVADGNFRAAQALNDAVQVGP